MSTNETAGRLPPELATPVTDLSKAVQGEPLTLQQIYERVTGVGIVAGAGVPVAFDQIVPMEPLSSDDIYQAHAGALFPRGPVVETADSDQRLMDELQTLLDANETAIRAPIDTTPAQENTMTLDSTPARTPTSVLGMTATEAGERAGSTPPQHVVARRSLMENVSDAHNATRAAMNAMTDLIAKMFGAEAAKTSGESYTGIGPMPAAEAGVVVNVEYMLRDIHEMTQKIEAQARVVADELG